MSLKAMSNMQPYLVDTHAHLTSKEMRSHLATYLSRARRVGVRTIVNVCTDEESLAAGISMQAEDPHVVSAAATTPHDVEREGETFFPLVEVAARDKKLVAVGETGLDYFYTHAKKEIQRAFLSRYFDLAQRMGLPLILHCREAFADLFAMADAEYRGRAVLHCFTGSLQEARGVLDRGWVLSMSGILTFKKAEALREVVRFVPLEHLVIETDSPYLAPQSHRGEVNEPSFLPEIVSCIAQIKSVSADEVAYVTAANAKELFALPH